MKWWCFRPLFVHIVYAKLGQADAGDNEAKLMTKLAPDWLRTSDPVIRSPARYRWTTAPAFCIISKIYLLLQNTTKYSDNMLCLLNWCQMNNWHILVRFIICIQMRRYIYILKCAILSTYVWSNNNYKRFRRKLGSNSFNWYITTINTILFEACGWWIYDKCQIASRSDTRKRHIRVPLCKHVMVQNGYCIPMLFLLTRGIVFRILLGFRKGWSGSDVGGGGGARGMYVAHGLLA